MRHLLILEDNLKRDANSNRDQSQPQVVHEVASGEPSVSSMFQLSQYPCHEKTMSLNLCLHLSY